MVGSNRVHRVRAGLRAKTLHEWVESTKVDAGVGVGVGVCVCVCEGVPASGAQGMRRPSDCLQAGVVIAAASACSRSATSRSTASTPTDSRTMPPPTAQKCRLACSVAG